MNLPTSASLPPRLRGSAASVYLAKRAKLLGAIRERHEPTRWQITRGRIADALVLIVFTVLAACAAFHLLFAIGGLILELGRQ